MISLNMKDSKIKNEPSRRVMKTQSNGLFRSFTDMIRDIMERENTKATLVAAFDILDQALNQHRRHEISLERRPASKQHLEIGQRLLLHQSSIEQTVTWIRKDLFVCKLDQEDIKDELGHVMDVPKELLAEDRPFKPKKWKDKPAWFKLADFLSLCVILISCKPIRIRIWFS